MVDSFYLKCIEGTVVFNYTTIKSGVELSRIQKIQNLSGISKGCWSSPALQCGVQSRKHADLHMKGLSDLHMKGLTEEWMCLCCLRPEEVAKVLPQSGQA